MVRGLRWSGCFPVLSRAEIGGERAGGGNGEMAWLLEGRFGFW